MLQFPNIDPVAFTVFDWPIYWYGIAYVTSFLIASSYIKTLSNKSKIGFTPDHAESIVTWVILGVILGGRLGYTLFYNFSYYMDHPADILKAWQGGMSFHGGLIGVIIAVFLFAYKHKLKTITITDHLSPAVCIGLFLGRISNFINGELYGKVSDVPWAIAFPHGGPSPRHPSQLYEAMLEGVVLFVILHFLSRKYIHKTGFLSGVFLSGYGICRIIIEFFREKDVQLTDGIHTYISQGQLLSIPMIIIGGWLVYNAQRNAKIKQQNS